MRYPWLAINYGNSLLGYVPTQDQTVTIAADLHYLRRFVSELRIGLPDWNFPQAQIDLMRKVVVMAKAAGFRVRWGITSTNTTLTVSNWPQYQAAVVSNAQWAQANGLDELFVCNELDHKHDGSLTDAQQRSNIRGLATAVKSAGFTNKVTVSVAQGSQSSWYTEGLGDLDTFGLDLYEPFPALFRTDLATLVANFGDRAYLSEWNVVNLWPQVQNMPGEQIAQLVANRVQDIAASGIKRAFYFTYDHIQYNNPGSSDNVWAAHLASGDFRRLWQPLVSGRRWFEA
jgi:hypothetical protein